MIFQIAILTLPDLTHFILKLCHLQAKYFTEKVFVTF